MKQCNVFSCNCYATAGIEKECRVIRDYYWKPPIEQLFVNKMLLSATNPDKSFLQMLTPGNFQATE